MNWFVRSATSFLSVVVMCVQPKVGATLVRHDAPMPPSRTVSISRGIEVSFPGEPECTSGPGGINGQDADLICYSYEEPDGTYVAVVRWTLRKEVSETEAREILAYSQGMLSDASVKSKSRTDCNIAGWQCKEGWYLSGSTPAIETRSRTFVAGNEVVEVQAIRDVDERPSKIDGTFDGLADDFFGSVRIYRRPPN